MQRINKLGPFLTLISILAALVIYVNWFMPRDIPSPEIAPTVKPGILPITPDNDGKG